jgi:diguanylate cyclase (GGDEF)-like protein
MEQEISWETLRNYNWGRILALLSRITSPVSELAPVLLDFISIDLLVDRLGLFVSRTSGDKTEFVLAGLHGGLKADKSKFGEVAEIFFDPNGGLIQESPTPDVGWDLLLLITPMDHNDSDKLKKEDILAILAIDDTSTAREFSQANKGLITVIHWALREFFTQRKIINLFRDTDPLTGLLNKNALAHRMKEIEELRKRSRRKNDKLLSLAMVDLDHFKNINTIYGEPFGDELLKAFSRILKEYFRTYDVVCRFGGEEFVIILDDLGEILVKRLEALLDYAQTLVVTHKGIKHKSIPFSAGVVDVDLEETVEAAIARAASLKQKAKEAGRAKILHE